MHVNGLLDRGCSRRIPHRLHLRRRPARWLASFAVGTWNRRVRPHLLMCPAHSPANGPTGGESASPLLDRVIVASRRMRTWTTHATPGLLSPTRGAVSVAGGWLWHALTSGTQRRRISASARRLFWGCTAPCAGGVLPVPITTPDHTATRAGISNGRLTQQDRGIVQCQTGA